MENQHGKPPFAHRDLTLTLQQRWENVEHWIQNVAPVEFRDFYNSIEVGPVTVVSEEEVKRLREQYGINPGE
jgi:hypothetical protein